MSYLKYIIFSLLLAVTITTPSFGETRVKQTDLALFCRIEGWMDLYVLRGERISEYAERNVAIFKTSNPNVFIVKDGLFDGNGRGIFLLIEEWKAYKTSIAGKVQFTSLAEPKQIIEVTTSGRKLQALHSKGLPSVTECTTNQDEVPEFWN